ncbi:MAG: hypothetical protein HN742_26460 [Lentisphaerae bacterium]|jgi:hypothetical protein|nr:hypothetical protein [Lentisphaerota bacterium]MBT5606006.1 hypothetical protein [Lentisphaerota bacterium]MBT7058605.1 hypothetical protein [Lentisphaerota bacterium]MBT7845445.1 hypothetical protein [Lentisphaerota bacterium]
MPERSPNTNYVVGRAISVLVLTHTDDAVAATTAIHAEALPGGRRRRLSWTGPVRFECRVRRHVARVVLPIVDAIGHALGLKRGSFELSATNIGAASAIDAGVRVGGMSADLPIFLAILSAYLELPLTDDVVSTGHIASKAGDVRTVGNIPAKLRAAIWAPRHHVFVCPDVDADCSVEALLHGEWEDATAALSEARGDMRVVPVNDLLELLEAVLSPQAVVLAGLRAGFHGHRSTPAGDGSLPERIGGYLASMATEALDSVVGEALLGADSEASRGLLDSWALYHIRRGEYPTSGGAWLRGLLSAVPPATRRLRLDYPLLDAGLRDGLLDLAPACSIKDAALLHVTVTDEASAADTSRGGSVQRPEADMRGSDALVALLDKISAQSLAERVGLPVDAARASYVLDSVLVRSADEFFEATGAFYFHLLRSLDAVGPGSTAKDLGPEAHDIIEEAFRREGGIRAAVVEGMEGTSGGMRSVLDRMTELLKSKKREQFIRYAFGQALDPLDYDGRVELIGSLLSRLKADLPRDLAEAPPERFASCFDAVVRAYAQSIENVSMLLRAM